MKIIKIALKFFLALILIVVIALVIIIPVRYFIFEPTQVGRNICCGLNTGDVVFMSKLFD